MEQQINSIKRFFYDRWPVKIYHDRVPTEIETPSIAYLRPDQTDGPYSKLEYETFNIMRVNIHEGSDAAAFNKALELSEAIRKNKYRVPLVNPDGTLSEKHVEIESVSASLVDQLEAQITITFAEQSAYN